MACQLYPVEHPQYSHFHKTFRQIDEKTWIVGGRLLITHLDAPMDHASWPGGIQGGWYHASEAPTPRPSSYPVKDAAGIRLLNHWREEGAMWEVGTSILKVRLKVGPNDTREGTTLRFLQEQTLSLQTPFVYADYEFDGYDYVVYNQLIGVPLNTAWGDMEPDLQDRCVSQIATFCRELAACQRDKAEGVDGRNMRNEALLLYPAMRANTSETMLENCEGMGLDCSKLVLAHNFMFSSSILFDWGVTPDGPRVVGVQDWAHAGFVPEEWVSASFSLFDDNLGAEWQGKIHEALRREGFHAPDPEPLIAWKKNSETESSLLGEKYWASKGRDRRLAAENHIIDVTKESENPGVKPFWDDVEPDDDPYFVFPVTYPLILESFHYPIAE
ncbi:hypothetical protein ACHAPT_005882 [Fusarium lateritium]